MKEEMKEGRERHVPTHHPLCTYRNCFARSLGSRCVKTARLHSVRLVGNSEEPTILAQCGAVYVTMLVSFATSYGKDVTQKQRDLCLAPRGAAHGRESRHGSSDRAGHIGNKPKRLSSTTEDAGQNFPTGTQRYQPRRGVSEARKTGPVMGRRHQRIPTSSQGPQRQQRCHTRQQQAQATNTTHDPPRQRQPNQQHTNKQRARLKSTTKTMATQTTTTQKRRGYTTPLVPK